MGKLLRNIIFNWSSIPLLLILFTLFAKACIFWNLKWWACTVTFLGFLHFDLSISSTMWSLDLHTLANSFIILLMSNSLWLQRCSGKMGMMLVSNICVHCRLEFLHNDRTSLSRSIVSSSYQQLLATIGNYRQLSCSSRQLCNELLQVCFLLCHCLYHRSPWSLFCHQRIVVWIFGISEILGLVWRFIFDWRISCQHCCTCLI